MIKKPRNNHSTTPTMDGLADTRGGCHHDHKPRPRPGRRPPGAVRTNFTVQQKLAGNSPFYTNGKKLYYRSRMGYKTLVPFYDVDPWVFNTRNS